MPGRKHNISLYRCYEDFKNGKEEPIAKGDITLKQGIYADRKMINMWDE